MIGHSTTVRSKRAKFKAHPLGNFNHIRRKRGIPFMIRGPNRRRSNVLTRRESVIARLLSNSR
jgi:hypothetical protein